MTPATACRPRWKENVLVGPLIVGISLVCSVDNVPLILIYRKFYRNRLALRLVACLWQVMSAAGLIIKYLFSGLEEWADAAQAETEITPALNGAAASHVTVMNSVMEGAPMWCPKPVIASDIPGNRGLLGDDYPLRIIGSSGSSCSATRPTIAA